MGKGVGRGGMGVGVGTKVGVGTGVSAGPEVIVGVGVGVPVGSVEAVGVGGNVASTVAWVLATTVPSKLGGGESGLVLNPQPAARPSSKRRGMSNVVFIATTLFLSMFLD